MRIRIYLTVLTSLLLPILFCGCKTSAKTGSIQYEYLLVERQGGGQLDFRVYPGQSRSHLNVYVSSSDFQPVEKRFQLQIDENNADAIDDFYKALNGQVSLKGKQKVSGKLKGTWLYLRFVRGNRETEVTNPELIQRFTLFEKLVREQIGMN